MELTVTLIAVSLVAGLGIGLLSGMLGVGGGTVLVPLFSLGYGLSAIQATATSLFTIIPTAVAGCITHIRQRTCVVGLGVAAGIGGAFFSPVGVYLASISPSWAIMAAAAAVIAWSAFKMLRKAIQAPKEKGGTSTTPPAPRTLPAKKLVAGLFIGCAAGLAAGYVGIGGGFLMTPMFVAFLNQPMKHASGTSLLAIAILSVPGVATQMMLGNVMVFVGLAVAAGSIPGAILGAKMIGRFSERGLRFAFGLLLVVSAIGMVARELMF